MPFGICSASEEFQRRINDAIGDIEGVSVIVDDILIYGKGKNYDEAVKDHDRKMIKLMERLRDKNIKLNESKMKLKMNEVSYMGHLITDDGLKSDPKKVEAISKMNVPTTVKELKSFLGMVNYHGKFMKNLSQLSEPLRLLEKKDVAWHWGAE